ncbi:MAG: GNAT family N-acetyltransferase [Candidatus Zhuqueibacterota bacterium]
MVRSPTDKNGILSEIDIVPLREADLQDVADLIQAMHPVSQDILLLRSHSRDYYHWMYYQNPAGNAFVFGARHEGRLISCFAMAPKWFKIDRSELLCGKTMDMFTHPDYQGLGLMNILASKVFETAQKSGITFWFVTPSKNSYPIFLNKWQYVESFELTYRFSVLNFKPLLEKLITPSAFSRIIGTMINATRSMNVLPKNSIKQIEVHPVNEFTEEVDILWANFHLNHPVIQIRNSKYLNWRYLANPDSYEVYDFKKAGALIGIIVLKQTIRNGLRIGEIVDYLFLDNNKQILRMMLIWAKRHFQKAGCAVVQCWVINSSLMEKKIMNAGLKKKRKQLKILLSPNVPSSSVYDKNNWFITQGDGNDI